MTRVDEGLRSFTCRLLAGICGWSGTIGSWSSKVDGAVVMLWSGAIIYRAVLDCLCWNAFIGSWTSLFGGRVTINVPHYRSVYSVKRITSSTFTHCAVTGFPNFTFTFHISRLLDIICKYDKICRICPGSLPKFNYGSRPSDHYFRSVCLFVCLFVCA